MMNRMNGRLLGALVGGVTLLGLAASPVFAQAQPASPAQPAKPAHKDKDQDTKHQDKDKHQDHGKDEKKKDDKAASKAKVGEPAPAFELKDTDGKTVKRSDYKGKVVVLEWFNPDCPVVQMHYKAATMSKTQDALKGKDVVWLSINSGAAGKEGAGKERNVEARTDWKMSNPVLLDEAGTTGRAYGARTTPHMFVIDKTGTLAYAGAIDDGGPGRVGKVNHVENAVNAVLKGETVSPAATTPYGCSVKYGKQGA
jgi:peroxiredoxin